MPKDIISHSKYLNSIRVKEAKKNAVKCCDEKLKYLFYLHQQGIIDDMAHYGEHEKLITIKKAVKNYQI